MNNLLSWVHPGFSVFAGPPVEAGNLESLESQARHIARPAMATDALRNDPTESWPWKPRRTRARAPPCSSWTRWSGFIGSRGYFARLSGPTHAIPTTPYEAISYYLGEGIRPSPMGTLINKSAQPGAYLL